MAGVPGEAKSEFLSVDGVRLHYLDRGNGGAPPVVCVHGYASSAQAFSAPARIFRDRFHFVVPDVRGHGERRLVVDRRVTAPSESSSRAARIGCASRRPSSKPAGN